VAYVRPENMPTYQNTHVSQLIWIISWEMLDLGSFGTNTGDKPLKRCTISTTHCSGDLGPIKQDDIPFIIWYQLRAPNTVQIDRFKYTAQHMSSYSGSAMNRMAFMSGGMPSGRISMSSGMSRGRYCKYRGYLIWG
jgi:hypothetical protein